MPLSRFTPQTQSWFAAAFSGPTPAQVGAWDAIAAGGNALVVAPTGSGKTLAAFLSAIDGLVREGPPAEARQRCRVLRVDERDLAAGEVLLEPSGA